MIYLRIGAVGPLVGDVHQKLVESGFGIDGADLRGEFYGMSTQEAVRAFQRSHNLTVDGIAGPKTLAELAAPGDAEYMAEGWRCDLTKLRPEIRPVIVAAIADVGRREDPDGSNDGPDLKKFRTGGMPWCALAASSWVGEAPGGSPWGRLASVWAIRDWCAREGRLVSDVEPLAPGDLAMVLRPRRRGHIGLVCDVLEGGRLATCEGNSGNAVRARVRKRSDFTAFARPIP